MFIDSHAHLQGLDYQGVLERAKQALVDFVICPSTDENSCLESVKIANLFDNVFSCIGFHPEDIKEFGEKEEKFLKNLAKNKKVVAIGEIGLDYHFTTDNISLQREAFEKQLAIANELKKPVVIHVRDAMADALQILEGSRSLLKNGGVVHCFSGSIEDAKRIMSLGLDFTIGGICTFKHTDDLAEVIKFLPLERILLETDTPYLSPQPFRGKPNEPKNIPYIAEKIAQLKNESIERVAKITSENAKRVFGI